MSVHDRQIVRFRSRAKRPSKTPTTAPGLIEPEVADSPQAVEEKQRVVPRRATGASRDSLRVAPVVPQGATDASRGPLRGAPVVDACVDGQRVRIVGTDEIVLECGNASITLRRNGKIVIRGTYVETHSEGTNRIKGAAVRIN